MNLNHDLQWEFRELISNFKASSFDLEKLVTFYDKPKKQAVNLVIEFGFPKVNQPPHSDAINAIPLPVLG